MADGSLREAPGPPVAVHRLAPPQVALVLVLQDSMTWASDHLDLGPEAPADGC